MSTEHSTGVHDHSVEDIQKHVRRYLIIGVALMIGTVMTVWASLIDFGSHTINIAVALLIASLKGFLVAGFFMHLISERKMIYGILLATTFFFAGLMYLTVWSMQPDSLVHLPHK